MSYANIIGSHLNVRPSQVAAAIELMDDGNTLPFIARYRKEKTGSLDEEQLRGIGELLGRLRALDERRETVLAAIAEQGKLTPQLEAEIRAAATLTALEDLYQPYKKKRSTRASVAREKGLEPLARADHRPAADAGKRPHRSPRPSSAGDVPRPKKPWPARATSWPKRSPITPACAS